MDGSFRMLNGLHPIVQYNGLYYPSIELVIKLSVGASIPDPYAGWLGGFGGTVYFPFGFGSDASVYLNYQNANPSFSPAGPDPAPQAVTLFGQTVNYYLGTNLNFPPGDTGSDGLDMLTVEIGEWWPYDPGDGSGPYWDASTGNPLRV